MSRTIYIDHTDTVFFQINTGIQRVQRNILSNALLAQERLNIKVRSIMLLGDNFFDTTGADYLSSVILHLFRPSRFRLLAISILPHFKDAINLYWKGPYKALLVLPLLAVITPVSILSMAYFLMGGLTKVTFKKSDIYFIPDASWWSEDFDFKKVIAMKKQGCAFVVLIHDIFPITHSSIRAENLNKFPQNFKHVCNYADLLVMNSAYTMAEVSSYLQESGSRRSDLRLTSFRPGCDIGLASRNRNVRPNLKKIFSKAPPYISVGTIEPRKNYQFLLDVFDNLWSKTNYDVSICIIGKYGWKSEQTVDRIKSHPKYNVNLFWFDDLSDYELIFCYKESKALLYPSLAEGFGLPLIEAINYRCKVMASDIPIFHEIGGTICDYFSLDSTEELYRLILDFENTEQSPIVKSLDFRYPNWRESTEELLKLILKNTDSP